MAAGSRIRRGGVVGSPTVNRQADDVRGAALSEGVEQGRREMADRLQIRFQTLRDSGQFDYRATPVWDAVFDALQAEGGTAQKGAS